MSEDFTDDGTSAPGAEGPVASRPVLAGVARYAVLLAATAIIGQVFTLARELFVAATEGTSPELDALLVAAVVPTMAASLLASGAASAIVPGYLDAQQREGGNAASRLFGAVLTWAAIFGTLLTALVVIVAGPIVAAAGPGLSPDGQVAAQAFVPFVAPMLVFSALGGLLSALFQAHDRLLPVAIAWGAGPLGSLIATITLWPMLGLTALALAMTLQHIVVSGVLATLAWRAGILPRPTLRAERQDLLEFGRHAGPLTLSASILQFNLLTDRAVASLLTPGAVSALRYGEGIIRLPMNAIGPAWSASIYPALVRASRSGGERSMGAATTDSMRYLAALFVPLSVATIALAPLLVQVVYVRGAFDARAAALTAGTLVGFAPLLYVTMVTSLLTGAHNAHRRGTFLLTMGILNAILNVVLNIAFGLVIGVAGVALSTSVTVAMTQWIKGRQLERIDPDFDLRASMVALGRATLVSAIVSVPIALIAWNVPADIGLVPGLAMLTGLTLVGLGGYVALSGLFGFREPGVIIRAIVAIRPRASRRAS